MRGKLIIIVNEVLENKGKPLVNSLNENTNLRNDIGFDSFDLAELTVKIEEKFNVDVFADGLVNTIGEIEKKLKENG